MVQTWKHVNFLQNAKFMIEMWSDGKIQIEKFYIKTNQLLILASTTVENEMVQTWKHVKFLYPNSWCLKCDRMESDGKILIESSTKQLY